MAITVTELQPVTSPSATAVAGGSLAATTTYYYKIVVFETTSQGPNGQNSFHLAFAAPSAEVSATTTGTNKSIQLSWTLPAKITPATSYLHCLIYRTTTAGDYSFSTAKLIRGTAANLATAVNAPVTFTDDGSRTLDTSYMYTDGIPYVVVSGGSSGTPLNEEDLYQAYVTAGNQAKFASRTLAPGLSGFYSTYDFKGIITASGTNYFTIRRGRTVNLLGRWLLGTGTFFYMGTSNTYGTNAPGLGAVLNVMGTTTDASNGPAGILALYNSTINDLTGLIGDAATWQWGPRPALNTLRGDDATTPSIVKNCRYYSQGSNNTISGNIVLDNVIYEGAPRIELAASMIPTINGTSFYGQGLYSFGNNYTLLTNCSQYVVSGGLEWFFHGGSTTNLRFIDLVNYTPTNEPPKGSAINNPSGTIYLRRWTLDTKIKDVAGANIQNAKLSIQNGSGYDEVFVNTGLTVSTTTIALADTTFSVSATAGLAINDYIKVEAEVMKITNIAGLVLTVLRGQLGTVANTWLRLNKPIYKMYTATPSNASGVHPQQFYLVSKHVGNGSASAPYQYDTTTYGPHVTTIRKYGYLEYRNSATISSPQTLALTLTTNSAVVASEATALAYTGISIDPSLQKITVTSNHTMQELYDYTQAWLCTDANLRYATMLTTADKNNFTLTYDLEVNNCSLTGGSTISMPTKTRTLVGTGYIQATVTDSVATYVQVTATVQPNSRVELYNVTTSTSITNTSSASGNFLFTITTQATSGDVIRLRVTNCQGTTAYLPFETTAIFSTSGINFLVNQVLDSIYNTNGIDGSSVTEFSADVANLQIDANDVDGETTAQRLYAWYCYNLTTSSGISTYFGGIVAEDVFNYKIIASILDLTIQNISATPLVLSGARIYRSDGASIFVAGSGPIQHDPDKAYLVNANKLLTLNQFLALK